MRYVLILGAFLLQPASPAAGEGPAEGRRGETGSLIRKTVISVEENLRVPEWSLSFKDLPATAAGPHWSVRKSVLHGGRQEGVDVIVVDNGRLTFTIVPTRGMSLWEGRAGDLRLGWDSPVKEVIHPYHVNLQARGGLGWLEGFGEWINRCGLESNGAPGPDEVPNNTGKVVTMDLTLHGRIGYLPAREAVVSIDEAPPHAIRVRGVVDETMMFGPQLRLIAEVSTEPGSNALTISDEIRNLGGLPQEMQLLYHCNFGSPLLEDGARLIAPAAEVLPRDPRAAEENGVAAYDRYGPPQSGYREQVYFLTLRGDPRGETEVLLRNRAGDRGASLRYPLRELPHFTVWKNTAALSSGYAVGLEPATNFPNPRSVERKAGRVVLLPPGGSYRTRLTVEALGDAGSVRAAESRIEAIK
jgi:hypothetical protein